MSKIIFGNTVDLLTAGTPSAGGYIVAYDLDGILKQKDEFGVITEIGGGPTGGIGATPSLYDVLSTNNDTVSQNIIMGTSTSILSSNGGGQIDMDVNSNEVGISTDNGSYTETYIHLKPNEFQINYNYSGSTTILYGGTSGQIELSAPNILNIKNNTRELLISNTTTASTADNDKYGAILSSRNSTINDGVRNSVVIGGQSITASQSNTVYLGGTVNINNNYNLPNSDGTSGYVMTTDGLGNITWQANLVGVRPLNEVLDAGNSSETYDIIMGTQTVIKSINGGGQVELDYNATSSVLISTDNGGFLKSYLLLNNSDITIGGDNIDITSNDLDLLSSGDILINANDYLDISGQTGSVIIGDGRGLVYGFDYSSTFVNNSLVSKLYVDNGTASLWGELNNYLPLSGGTMSGDIETSNAIWSTNGGYIDFSGASAVGITNDNNGYSNEGFYMSPGYSSQFINGYSSELAIKRGLGMEAFYYYDSSVTFGVGGDLSLLVNPDFALGLGTLLNAAKSSNFLISTSNGSIDGSASNSGLLGGFLNSISNLAQRSVILGGSNITATKADTAYTQHLEVKGDAVIDGNLTVSGTQTVVNTENLYVEDNIITLNATYSGPATVDAGVEVNLGDGTYSKVLWDAGTGYWQVGLSGSESTIITEAGSGLLKSNNELSVDFGTVSSISYVDTGTASIWAAIESSNELSEVLSNGNITDGNNITLSGSDVLQTGTTTSGSQILLDYSGGGKDILISNDGGNEGEAGIYISNENGFYGTTLYQDGYNANMILEKTSGWVGPTGGGSGYNFTVTFNSQSGSGNYIIPFKASDLSSQIFNGTKGTNLDKYGFVSFGFVDSDVQFFGGGTGAGSIHSNQTYFVEGVENSVSIGTSQARVKTNNTLYINQLGHTEDATKESLIQFTTLTDSRTLIIPDASGTFSLLSDLDTATNSLWSAIDSINNDYITEVIGGQGLTGGGTAGTVTLDVQVDNGLSIESDIIVLGGTLSQNTTINGSDLDLTLGNIGTILMTASTFDVEADGFVSIDAGTGSAQFLADDNITISSNSIDLASTSDINLTFTSSSITDSGNGYGLVYASDYSGTFVTNSLVSKLYVDTLIGSSDTLAEILAVGNTSSTDIIMTEGDDIVFKYSGFNNRINTQPLTSHRNINFPDASGTVALTSDLSGYLPLSGGTLTGNLVVNGDLTISGTQTVINTENLYVEDNIITLNATFSGTPTLDSGIEVNRGSGTWSKLFWDESQDYWVAGLSGSESVIITENGTGLNKTGNELSVDTTTIATVTYVDAKKYTEFGLSLTASVASTITHNLGTQSIICQAWDTSTGETVNVTFKNRLTNSVDILSTANVTVDVIIQG